MAKMDLFFAILAILASNVAKMATFYFGGKKLAKIYFMILKKNFFSKKKFFFQKGGILGVPELKKPFF